MLHTSLRLHMCLRVLLGYEPKKQSQKSFLLTLKLCLSTSGPSTCRLTFPTEICNNGANVLRKTLPIQLRGRARPAAIKQIKSGVTCSISAIPHKFSLYLFIKQKLYFRDQNLLSAYWFEEATPTHRQLGVLTWSKGSSDARRSTEQDSRCCSFLTKRKKTADFCEQKEFPEKFL